MTWNHEHVLLALWLLPLLAVLIGYSHRRRKEAAQRFVDQKMTQRLMPKFGGDRLWIKGTLLILGLGLLIVAAAGPRFGMQIQQVERRGVDLFVCLDVSKSMMAEDVKPSRLERAKSDIRDLLPELEGDRVGLIVFAGKPVIKVPLTDDQSYYRMVLDEINTSSAPRGGSLIGDAIRKAIEAMPEDKTCDQVVVMITDGEDHESLPREAAQAAAERGVKVFTIGLGDADEGARIPIRDDQGQLHYVQDSEGREVWSELDDELLRDIAATTGGAYVPAGTKVYDLGKFYRESLSDLTRGTLATEKKLRYQQQYQGFLLLGIVLLMTDLAIPAYRRRLPIGRIEI